MIFSDHYKVVGIGIPKTATRSFAASLSMDYVRVSPGHPTALDVSGDLENRGKVWGDYYSFVITRNPWDRYYSFYNFLVGARKSVPPRRVDPKLIFKAFISQMASQDSFFLDGKGDVMVEHLGDFENLNAEFAHLCGKMGIEERPLQHVNTSKSVATRDELFDDEVVDIIAQKEAVVIGLMGYSYPG